MSDNPVHRYDPPSTTPILPGATLTTASGYRVTLVSVARMPSKYGDFTIVAFENDGDQLDHVALVRGALANREDVPTRLHSECVTGEVFGSLKCDCGGQLELALATLGQSDMGILLYMRQEGRGIGLTNKIRAYALQDLGMDTVEANLHLGFDDDLRDYELAAGMLTLLEPGSIALFTNNPAKIEGLEAHGVTVTRRIPHHVELNTHNRSYIDTKQKKSGHLTK